DADMPPLTKGMELFLRFAYAPIPKLFNDLQSECYFENRYNYGALALLTTFGSDMSGTDSP
ncbi:MAG: hypothetical protein KKD47_02200, partial [Proteobacteria bacterium]|nr:hypothetical protein [Pseudomonadota bacterium]